MLKEKFRPEDNEMIMSLQYLKFHNKDNESAQEWMGRFHIKATKCNYKEHNRRLKEQFIYGIYDDEIPQEIIRKLKAQRNT